MAVHVGALIPLALLIRDAAMGNFLVDPVREITTRTGRTSLILLMLTLSCTPLTLLTGWRYATQIRRPLGLYTALYVGLHLFTFIGLDYRFDWGLMFDDIGDQRYVLVGAAAAGILALLTLTSTRSWQRRLGRNWKRLHRLVYLAGVLAVVHFLWLSKDPREPLRFALLLAILLAFRLSPVRRGLIDLRTRFRVPRRQPWGI